MAVFEFGKKLYKLQLGGFERFCKKTYGEYCKDEDLEFTFEVLRSAIDAYQFMFRRTAKKYAEYDHHTLHIFGRIFFRLTSFLCENFESRRTDIFQFIGNDIERATEAIGGFFAVVFGCECAVNGTLSRLIVFIRR